MDPNPYASPVAPSREHAGIRSRFLMVLVPTIVGASLGALVPDPSVQDVQASGFIGVTMGACVGLCLAVALLRVTVVPKAPEIPPE